MSCSDSDSVGVLSLAPEATMLEVILYADFTYTDTPAARSFLRVPSTWHAYVCMSLHSKLWPLGLVAGSWAGSDWGHPAHRKKDA